MKNRLNNQTSPYLLQHAQNPVDWFPWCGEAFKKAAAEDKPVFLSVGYSTCHWCHVMAHESFENQKTAEILNKYFISIKVDREERPDIDSVYMSVCQAYTGNGGWPMSIFMTAQQKPFFAGTYFPPVSGHGRIGFQELLLTIADRWTHQRTGLLASADQVLSALLQDYARSCAPADFSASEALRLPAQAAAAFSQSFDPVHGGFGPAPKFPLPHNLMFLMLYAALFQEDTPREQALFTLNQMRKGGIFDQIGGGFSRYSTDERYLAPHFEKMLYDNALLIIAYAAAYKASKTDRFLNTAIETADYILREMTSPDGAFYSAQDADSEGEEGKYYTFACDEICRILGSQKGSAFCRHYDITKEGNFEGQNIPNLLSADDCGNEMFQEERKQLYRYRKSRRILHLDDKVLTSWNSLMICAMAILYRVSGQSRFLMAAQNAQSFLEKHLTDQTLLYTSCRNGRHSSHGFLDDYACQSVALLSLYEVSGNTGYLKRALSVCQEAHRQFADPAKGGYFLYGAHNDPLITRPKESYDGALPGGNSMMAYALVRLSQLTESTLLKQQSEAQLAFLSKEAAHHPAGYCFYLIALLFHTYPPQHITIVLSEEEDAAHVLPALPLYASLTILQKETDSYRLLHDRTTYYVCKDSTCLPPTNDIPVTI